MSVKVRVIFLQDNNLIEAKLLGQYKDFLNYCNESGKKFVDELDSEDFIAYRTEYSVPREQVEQLKNLLNFQEHTSTEKISNEPEDSLQKYFSIDDIKPYENVLISKLDFNTRVQRCLKFNGYRTLTELLKSSQQELSSLRNFGKKKSLLNRYSLPIMNLMNFYVTRL